MIFGFHVAIQLLSRLLVGTWACSLQLISQNLRWHAKILVWLQLSTNQTAPKSNNLGKSRELSGYLAIDLVFGIA